MTLMMLRFWTKFRYYSTATGNSVKAKLNKPSPTVDKASNTKMVSQPAPSLQKDIVIFRYDNATQFKYINFFAITQFGFWMYISYSSLSLVSVPVKTSPAPVEDDTAKPSKTGSQTSSEDLAFYRKINLGENKYKFGLFAATMLMGYGILFGSWTYILRSVRYIVLRKDKKTVSFVTYDPMGRNRVVDAPLDNVSAYGSRFSGSSQMPIKVKNKILYYIVDMKGEFPLPQLFDQTVGIKRNLKK